MGNHGVTVSVSKVKSGEPESLGEKNETQKYLLRPIGQESGRSKGREKREDRAEKGRQAGRQALASSGGRILAEGTDRAGVTGRWWQHC